jgi:hypothetical protein
MMAMKNTAVLQGHGHHRRGGAFAYVMAYMTLSTMLLALSGSTLHSIMRMSDVDRKMFREIHIAEDVAAELREDGARCVVAQLAGNRLVIQFPDASSAAWTVKKHQLLREVVQSGQVQSRGQFRFQPGTELTFRQESDRLVILRITAPPLAYLPTTSVGTGGVLKFIDVLLSIPQSESNL